MKRALAVSSFVVQRPTDASTASSMIEAGPAMRLALLAVLAACGGGSPARSSPERPSPVRSEHAPAADDELLRTRCLIAGPDQQERYEFDRDGRLVLHRIEGAGTSPRTRRFEYDSAGDLVRRTTEIGDGPSRERRVRTYTYPASPPSSRTQQAHEDGQPAEQVVWRYDDAGRPVSALMTLAPDPEHDACPPGDCGVRVVGVIRRCAYDAQGRPTRRTDGRVSFPFFPGSRSGR